MKGSEGCLSVSQKTHPRCLFSQQLGSLLTPPMCRSRGQACMKNSLPPVTLQSSSREREMRSLCTKPGIWLPIWLLALPCCRRSPTHNLVSRSCPLSLTNLPQALPHLKTEKRNLTIQLSSHHPLPLFDKTSTWSESSTPPGHLLTHCNQLLSHLAPIFFFILTTITNK